MKRLVIPMVLCGTIFCACTVDKNRVGNNLSTGSSIDTMAGIFMQGMAKQGYASTTSMAKKKNSMTSGKSWA